MFRQPELDISPPSLSLICMSILVPVWGMRSQPSTEGKIVKKTYLSDLLVTLGNVPWVNFEFLIRSSVS
ncbi:hypothetical protein VTK73DRAFT_4379 [Phialemonium thermophilum]|uniref:Uncharacterized protein n=1 Tax=Phialemonium thermophilum TaxID=223376 RepID=A0ABR3XZB9_9PEZI